MQTTFFFHIYFVCKPNLVRESILFLRSRLSVSDPCREIRNHVKVFFFINSNIFFFLALCLMHNKHNFMHKWLLEPKHRFSALCTYILSQDLCVCAKTRVRATCPSMQEMYGTIQQKWKKKCVRIQEVIEWISRCTCYMCMCVCVCA